jgi:hypothetical protein
MKNLCGTTWVDIVVVKYIIADCIINRQNVFTGQKGRTTVCNYDNFKEPLLIELRREYDYICKYSNTPRKM